MCVYTYIKVGWLLLRMFQTSGTTVHLSGGPPLLAHNLRAPKLCSPGEKVQQVSFMPWINLTSCLKGRLPRNNWAVPLLNRKLGLLSTRSLLVGSSLQVNTIQVSVRFGACMWDSQKGELWKISSKNFKMRISSVPSFHLELKL